jgi:hypothetical protein
VALDVFCQLKGRSPMARIIGPDQRLYADPTVTPDEITFREDNTSEAYYNSVYYLAHKNQVQTIPTPRAVTPLDLANYVPPSIIQAIEKAGKISFHAVGDTGAAKANRTQTAATSIGHEGAVADAMAHDVDSQGAAGPAFFFHLGDVIYNFGEAQYYYDQFYEPFRAYDRPIFAIPGNHDGMVFGPGSAAPQTPTLAAFLTNFCAVTPGPSPDAGGLVRSVMTQPGVYFTLDAPFVSIIGLYSNVLEGPGVISSQGKHFPITDDQKKFLQSELVRLKPLRDAGKRAVIIALHHPPLSADARHAGSTGIQQDLDDCCKAAALWPDLVLSGHAHLYQRFTRTSPSGKQTPYIVSGSGGFAATAPQATVTKAPITIGDHRLEILPIVAFGYLTITADANSLTIAFKTADQKGVTLRDSVAVDLRTGKLTAQASAGASPRKRAPKKTAAKRTRKAAPRGKRR